MSLKQFKSLGHLFLSEIFVEVFVKNIQAIKTCDFVSENSVVDR
jgi:hypothetical protein